MTQLEIPLSRNTDPVTSHVAAQRALVFKDNHESRIFGVLYCCPNGSTYREIAEASGLEPVAVARRMKGMERRGLIKRWTNEYGKYEQRNGMCVWRKA